MRRCCVALNLPQDVKEVLRGIQTHLGQKNRHIRVKWANPEIIHLTLHFLGDVDVDREYHTKTAGDPTHQSR